MSSRLASNLLKSICFILLHAGIYFSHLYAGITGTSHLVRLDFLRKSEAVNLKQSKESYMGDFEGNKERGDYRIASKNKGNN